MNEEAEPLVQLVLAHALDALDRLDAAGGPLELAVQSTRTPSWTIWGEAARAVRVEKGRVTGNGLLVTWGRIMVLSVMCPRVVG